MALLTDAAERQKIAPALAFGAMNGAWAAGNVVGPALGGWLAEVAGDSLPYLLLALVCLLTFAATMPWAPRYAPGEVAAEQLVEPPVRLREVGGELRPASPASSPSYCARRRAGRLEPVRRGPEKLEHLRVRPLGLGEELLAREDQ